MKKKQRNKIIIGSSLVILFIIVLFLVGGLKLPFALTSTGAPTYQCTGGISADITKIERMPGASTFKIIATANRAGDCLKIAWTEDDINTYLQQASPDEMVENGVYSDLILNSQIEKFFTSQDNRKVEKYLFYDVGWTLSKCSVDNCKTKWNKPTTKYAIRTIAYPGPCACVYTDEVGNFAPFSGVKSRGGNATLYVSGLNPIVINYGTTTSGTFFGGSGNVDNKLSITWRGDLLGPRFIGTPGSPYQPFNARGFYKLTTSNYENVQPTSFSIYANGKWWVNLEDCLGKNVGWELKGTADAKNCVDAFNIEQAKRLVNKKQQYIDGTRGTVKSASFEGSDLVLNVEPYSTEFPQFELLINAAWVGVHYVLGKPDLECPADFDVDSGQTKNFNVKISNIDPNENGNFGITMTCGELSSGISPIRVSLAPGQSENLIAYVTKSTTQKITQKCTVTATTVRLSDRKDECSFNVEVNPIKRCVPGEKKCSDDLRQLGSCKEDGSDYTWVSCNNGCEYISGGAQCRGVVCKKEGETATTQGECCSGLILKDGKCVKGELLKCQSCIDWTKNLFRSESEKCEPSTIIEKKWYNPITYFLKEDITQDDTCPVVLIFYVVSFLVILGIMGLIILILVEIIKRSKRK